MSARWTVGLLLCLFGSVSRWSRAEAPESAPSGLEFVFGDDFESGDLTAWDSATGDPPGTSLPPDPANVAPPHDPTIAVDIFEANRFLWEAAEPIQVGVLPGALEPKRVSFVRGRALQSDGTPLRGVRVHVFGEPQLGFTFSRADGVYDITVNGGGGVVLTYE